MRITFTNISEVSNDVLEIPKPASHFLPEWYKNMPTYISGNKEPNRDDPLAANQTLKKCMPVFDMMTAGYIITTACDIWVEPKNGEANFTWTNLGFIAFHPISQTQGHPDTKNGNSSPKFMNPWSIKTEKGYSSLFITPSHQDIPFDLMPGIVDTDTFTNPVNLPFKLKDPLFRGLIPAGTPMVQVIPIKRDKWQMSIGGEKEKLEVLKIRNKMDSIFWDRYKRFWWNKKEYK